MSFDQKKFLSSAPASFEEVFNILQKNGLTPTLVGGAVRDYFLFGKTGSDWDIELSHKTLAFSREYWKNLGDELARLGKVTYLPYEIIRLTIKNHEFEFSPPREETFKDNWQQLGHSNFEAQFNLQLPFESSVNRRDFTINAIGLRFVSLTQVEWLDPFNAQVHLREKLLHHCSENFQKDPVRFLRALRFKVKFEFNFTPELSEVLKLMPIKNFSATHVWMEIQKSKNPILMLKTILEWQEIKPEMKLPVSSFELAGKWEDLKKVLVDPSQHESWLIALEWVGVSAESWQKYFSVGSETAARLSRWAINSKAFIQIKPEIFHGEFEGIRELPEFSQLFDWFFTTKQLLQKNPNLPLMKMIEEFLPDWIHLYRFEVVKDVKHIDPPLRAKYQVWNLCQRL